jgi:hypothetical protein
MESVSAEPTGNGHRGPDLLRLDLWPRLFDIGQLGDAPDQVLKPVVDRPEIRLRELHYVDGLRRIVDRRAQLFDESNCIRRYAHVVLLCV